MDAVDIQALLKKQEDLHFDRTETTKNQESIGQTISAFATAEGGLLLIGQKDDGAIVGVENEQLDVTRIGEALRNCEPMPTVEGPVFYEVGDKKVAVVRVIPLGKGGPCFYKNTAYARVMDSNTKMKASEIYKIWSRTGKVSFELRPSSGELNSIDREVLDNYLKTVRERGEVSESAFLESRHLKEDSRLTNVGVIVLSKRPADFLPRPVVTLIRFRGTDPRERIAATSLSLPLHKLIPACENFIVLNLAVKEMFDGMRRIEKPVIPIIAIREALVNAIAHRDYESTQETMIRIFDDRIEFSNPGAPDSETLRMILERSIPVHRNPLLYEFLRYEGFGEGAGQGIALMKKEMYAEGLPDPKIQTLMDLFFVTLYSIPVQKAQLSEWGQILTLAEKGRVTTSQVGRLLNISRPTALKILNAMTAAGRLVHVGKGRSSAYLLKELK
ncbi:MAG: ATP-binding protein [Candidatus Micrarchaeota archaeon]